MNQQLVGCWWMVSGAHCITHATIEHAEGELRSAMKDGVHHMHGK